MSTTKKVILAVTFLLFVLMLGLSMFTLWVKDTMYASSILSVFVTLAIFLHALNLTDTDAGNKSDELTQHVKNHSAKVSYIVLMLAVAIIFIFSENIFTDFPKRKPMQGVALCRDGMNFR